MQIYNILPRQDGQGDAAALIIFLKLRHINLNIDRNRRRKSPYDLQFKHTAPYLKGGYETNLKIYEKDNEHVFS